MTTTIIVSHVSFLSFLVLCLQALNRIDTGELAVQNSNPNPGLERNDPEWLIFDTQKTFPSNQHDESSGDKESFVSPLPGSENLFMPSEPKRRQRRMTRVGSKKRNGRFKWSDEDRDFVMELFYRDLQTGCKRKINEIAKDIYDKLKEQKNSEGKIGSDGKDGSGAKDVSEDKGGKKNKALDEKVVLNLIYNRN